MTNGTLTPQTKIQVGLAVTLVGAAAAMFMMIYNMKESLVSRIDAQGTKMSGELSELTSKIDQRYIPRELFTSEIGSLRREREAQFKSFDQKLDMQAQRLSEVKGELSALKPNK